VTVQPIELVPAAGCDQGILQAVRPGLRVRIHAERSTQEADRLLVVVRLEAPAAQLREQLTGSPLSLRFSRERRGRVDLGQRFVRILGTR
jgi:hypothetical protein